MVKEDKEIYNVLVEAQKELQEILIPKPKVIKCRKCKEEIAMIRNGKGHLIPVNLDTITETDTEYDSAKHVKHKTTCKKV